MCVYMHTCEPIFLGRDNIFTHKTKVFQSGMVGSGTQSVPSSLDDSDLPLKSLVGSLLVVNDHPQAQACTPVRNFDFGRPTKSRDGSLWTHLGQVPFF